MTTTAEWIAMEDAISRRLVAQGAPQDRGELLAEISVYARAVWSEARRTGEAVPPLEERDRALDWLCQPVFVCGHHRSGTTLLQRLLDGHPQLLVLPDEGTYLSSFAYAARPDLSPHDIDRFGAEWIARFVDPNDEPHFKLGRSALDGNPSLLFARRLLGWRAALIDARRGWRPFTLLLALAAAYRDVSAPSSAPTIWVEKTPLNERNVHRFAAFPQARFIQLVREPSATLTSLRQRYSAAGSREFDLAGHTQAVGRSLRLARKHSQELSSRYLVVRYEDLVGNLACEMERVRAFLGICEDATLLIPTVGTRPVRSNSSFARSGFGVVEQSHHPRALSPADLQLISALTASAARPLGYDIAQVNVRARTEILLRQLPGNAVRYVRALGRRLHGLTAENRARQ